MKVPRARQRTSRRVVLLQAPTPREDINPDEQSAPLLGIASPRTIPSDGKTGCSCTPKKMVEFYATLFQPLSKNSRVHAGFVGEDNAVHQ